MWVDPRDMRNTASYWPQGLANGNLFTHCLVEESKEENELFLFILSKNDIILMLPRVLFIIIF